MCISLEITEQFSEFTKIHIYCMHRYILYQLICQPFLQTISEVISKCKILIYSRVLFMLIVRLNVFTFLVQCFSRKLEFMLFVFIYVYWCPIRSPYHMILVSFNCNTTGVECGAVTANPSGVPEFTLDFQWGVCYSIFSFLHRFCRAFFVPFPLVTVLSFLPFTASDYPLISSNCSKHVPSVGLWVYSCVARRTPFLASIPDRIKTNIILVGSIMIDCYLLGNEL